MPRGFARLLPARRWSSPFVLRSAWAKSGLMLGLALPFSAALAQPPAGTPSTVVRQTMQVTATRVPEDVLDVPASITVISGEELAARGVRDLPAALSLVAGVTVAPGSDQGPASSVPELMGLRELDAFLLVVDGVPWGGAFNPALASLDLIDVDRIEVLRGAAPVLFGATSFVGVIHVIHNAPEDSVRQVHVFGGSYGTGGADVTVPLGGGDGFRSTLSARGESRGLRDDRAGWDRGHVLWNGAGEVGGGRLRLQADLTGVRQDPASPHPREGTTLSSRVPLDANHNPRDARFDEDRLHLMAGYDRPVGDGQWSSTFSVTRVDRDRVRGFLREDLDATLNAAGYRQEQEETDFFLDSHLAWRPADSVRLVAGFDLLGGRGEARSENFLYRVGLDGSGAPPSRDRLIVERPELEDERAFAGLYGLLVWTPTSRWRIELGARLNRTEEKREGEVETEDGEELAVDERDDTEVSGGVGVSYRIAELGEGAVWGFADWKDTFKPAAIDFGPEAEGGILDPESAQTLEAGLKGEHLGGRFGWRVSAFTMDFENLVIPQSVDGRPTLVNGGEERFEGVELEADWRPSDELTLVATYADHDARFRDYERTFDGVLTQLRGKRPELSADRLASLGLVFSPLSGFFGYVTAALVGERYLDKRNRALADDFTTWAAGFGYRFERLELRVDGENLSDERDPVSESELGDAQYYRQPARSVVASLGWRF